MGKFIAIYGGSYNLPTTTHRSIGIAVRKDIKPDSVWYMVSPQNPFKSTDDMAPFEHRVAMARLNIEGESGLEVTDIEREIREKVGSTQTADVLRELMQRDPGTRFSWVMGADCFAELSLWRGHEFILTHVPIIVIPRKGHTQKALASPAAGMAPRLDKPELLRTTNGWHLLDFPEDDVNATNNRIQAKAGINPANVRPDVFQYAKQNGLFL